MYAGDLYLPFSRGDIGIEKHNLVIKVLLLTHSAINLWSAMLNMMVSQQEAGPKSNGIAQSVSMEPGSAWHLSVSWVAV